ncbi:unnamed protein product [Amoebophrya sp. A25]|nr:unnamed protein product [Amoebophrya sp. A25]|eukprot:GSA25T00013592001.1
MAHSLAYEIKKINELNEAELAKGQFDLKVSWHREFRDSAYIRVDHVHAQLTEGDLVVVFSQFGEIADVRLIRDQETGKSRGFCFICYEDTRSAVYAVDNMNGYCLCGKHMKVMHVLKYEVPILLDETQVDEDGNYVQLEYKPTGPEGYGVGVTQQLPSVKTSSSNVVADGKKDKKDRKKDGGGDKTSTSRMLTNGGSASSKQNKMHAPPGTVGMDEDDEDLAAFEQHMEDSKVAEKERAEKRELAKEKDRLKKKEKKRKKREKKERKKEKKAAKKQAKREERERRENAEGTRGNKNTASALLGLMRKGKAPTNAPGGAASRTVATTNEEASTAREKSNQKNSMADKEQSEGESSSSSSSENDDDPSSSEGDDAIGESGRRPNDNTSTNRRARSRERRR